MPVDRMHNWFECKVKYQKIDENAKEKKVTEPYLIDALSFTEAEARINKEMEPFLGSEFSVSNIRRANYSEIFYDERADKWYKAKVLLTLLDPNSEVEKKTAQFMLVQAEDLEQSLKNLNEGLKGSMSDYEIVSIQETMLMDIFKYEIDNADKL